MITHVKRNNQKVRTAYIKPSRIEAAVHLNSGELFQANINSHHKSQMEANYDRRNRDVQIAILNEYMRKIQTLYGFPYPPFTL